MDTVLLHSVTETLKPELKVETFNYTSDYSRNISLTRKNIKKSHKHTSGGS
jgi:hypothetical protein